MQYDIWMEGYKTNGEEVNDVLIGRGYGATFDDAVKDYMIKNPEIGIKENGRNRYMSEQAYQDRTSNWNIWGCRLFKNNNNS
jgi:hypothetical protein